MDICETLVVSFIEKAMFYIVLALMTPEERLYYLMTASIMSNLANELTSSFGQVDVVLVAVPYIRESVVPAVVCRHHGRYFSMLRTLLITLPRHWLYALCLVDVLDDRER
jgi:hypothetical protein